MMRWPGGLAGLGAALTLGLGSARAEAPELPHRWLFVMRSMAQPESLQRTIELLPRAKAAGYNAIVLSDHRLWTEREASPGHADALRKLQAEAKTHGLDLIPCVMPIGYSGRIIGADPNLAEGLPVKEAVYTVRSGVAVLTPFPLSGCALRG